LSAGSEFECAVCGYRSSNRAEFVEFRDPVKLPRVVERARARGRGVGPEDVKYLCLKCSAELYQEETRSPRSIRVVCPRCGEVIEVWL
jgi:DNA-directed RNA polymerase subunit RPC12/RpoP